MEGRLFIFSAPSGSGKSTIVKHLVGAELGLVFSISATSRPPRQGEVNGREYHFISVERFRELIRKDAFVEWEEVYPEQYYGTLKSEVERIWDLGKHAIFDIDVMGGLRLKKLYGSSACAIFVKPPSLEELERRLRSRGTDDPASLTERLDKAGTELKQAKEFDHILVNDSLDTALKESERLVREFIASG